MIPSHVIERARAVCCADLMRAHWNQKQFKALAGPCPKCGGDDRFGISRKKNLWHCRHCDKGGGPIDLVQHIEGVDFRRAIEILTGERARGCRAGTTIQPPAVKTESKPEDGEISRIKAAGAIWRASKPLPGTIAETYLKSRKIDLDRNLIEGGPLRFHPACPFRRDDGATIHMPAMIALLTGIEDNKPRGIHRTALKPDGSGKAVMPDGSNPKKMLGIATGCAIKLDADEYVLEGLHIGEGVETVLSARMLGFRPAWALGSAGAIGKLPVVLDCDGQAAVESLILLEEDDKSGANARAIVECGERWAAAGCEVLTVKPIHGGDCNDAIARLTHG